MSDASKRVLAWREQKREEGYMPVTLWIPSRVKQAMATLAFQRHQDLGELLVEAFQAWTPAKAAGASGVLTPAQVAALIDHKIAEALASQPAEVVPAPLPPPGPQHHADPLPPPPVGMKQCGKGHAPYPATKAECPTCVRDRTRVYRQNKAKEKRGEVPGL